jgi:hypothetical protein
VAARPGRAASRSPFLSLVSEERIQQLLKMMGQPAGARPTQGSLGKFAVRAAAAAVLEGSDCKPQSQYVLGLRAKNCRTEDVLDEEISVGTNSAGKVA